MKTSADIMTAVDCTALLVLGLALCKFVISAQLSAKNRHNVLKGPSLTVSDHDPGFLSISWDPHLMEHMMDYTVKYQFFHRFQNKTEWIEERKMKKYANINLNSHSNVWVKVNTQLFHDTGLEAKPLLESNWTEVFYTVPLAPLENLSCIVYRLSSLNCTWQIVKGRSSEDAQFLFAFRYRKKEFKCQNYFTNKEKRNIGCHVKDMYFNSTRGTAAAKRRLHATVWSNSSTAKVNRVYLPARIEKLNPPSNVSLSTEEGGLRVRWTQPLTIGSSQPTCFLYQVNLTEANKMPIPYVVEGGELEQLIPNYDTKKKYSVQVQAKKNCNGAKSKDWGEWSEPIFIGKEDDVGPWTIVIIVAIFLTLVFVLLTSLWKRYGGLKVILTPIPHPSDKLKHWLVSKENQSQNLVFSQNEVVAKVEILTHCKPGWATDRGGSQCDYVEHPSDKSLSKLCQESTNADIRTLLKLQEYALQDQEVVGMNQCANNRALDRK